MNDKIKYQPIDNSLKLKIDLYIQNVIKIDDNIICNYVVYNDIIDDNKEIDERLKHLDDTFQQSLFYHIDRLGLDEVKVYNDAKIDRRLFSKIRSNIYFKPSKKTAISLCIGLKLNLDDTLDLLDKAGYTLSHSNKHDIIIEYCIQNKIYDINTINQILFEYQESLLY